MAHHARTENPGRPGLSPVPPQRAPGALTATDVEVRLVAESFGWMAADPDAAMEYLYSRLFVAEPDTRALFPFAMDRTRAATFRMLTRLIAALGTPAATGQLLAQLAVTHRKFGVRDEHYRPFFAALLATAEHVAGPRWTQAIGAAWQAVLHDFGTEMTAASARDAAERPAWWLGEIVTHDRRSPTIAVLTIRPDRPLRYLPGQYLSVQVPRWPRIWRSYSIANAPRPDGLLDLHVRAIPGGMVSNVLVGHCAAGDTVVLGPPRGDMTPPGAPAAPADGCDLVCVAGGTGLAPVKAIVQAVVAAAGPERRPAISLYAGGRAGEDLYDRADLEKIALGYPPLKLIQVGERCAAERLVAAVAGHPRFTGAYVYVAGPAGLVEAVTRAIGSRVPEGRIRHDPIELLRDASSGSSGRG